MSDNTPQHKPKLPIQAIFVLAILILFPVISFLINIKGAEAGKNFYKELKQDLGKLPDFQLYNWQNENLNADIFKGDIRVVSFTNNENRDAVLNTIRPIVKTEQFRDNEVVSLVFINFDTVQDSTFYKPYVESFNQKDRKLWQILRGGNELPTLMKLPNLYNVSLVDTAGVIRHFYDVRNEDDRRKLVEHIAVMPIKKKQKVEKIERKER